MLGSQGVHTSLVLMPTLLNRAETGESRPLHADLTIATNKKRGRHLRGGAETMMGTVAETAESPDS